MQMMRTTENALITNGLILTNGRLVKQRSVPIFFVSSFITFLEQNQLDKISLWANVTQMRFLPSLCVLACQSQVRPVPVS